MGIGFTDRDRLNGQTNNVTGEQIYPVAPKADKESSSVVKTVTTIIGTAVLLGTLVWGAAMLASGKASNDDLDDLEDRIELVEKNDIAQTIILEQIKDTVDKIDKKLENFLTKRNK